jgi:peptidyl-prolyl cis-trans isomerase A (cyclophilin A)
MRFPVPLLVLLIAAIAGSACGPREKASPDAAPEAVATPTPVPPPPPPLLDPQQASETAPDRFKVRFETTEGPFVVEVRRKWAPNGADRFYNLVKLGYYDGVTFFRVLDNFMAQFGIHGDPDVSAVWRNAQFPDDPVVQSNTRGMVTFATAGPDTRTTQIFINYKDNGNLDGMGFAPFGRVVEGMAVVDKLHSAYGEGAPSGRGPAQGRAEAEGNEYFRSEFPDLDHIETARLVETKAKAD